MYHPVIIPSTQLLIIKQVDHTLREYILGEDIYAPQDAPSAATTNVDGYALRCTCYPLQCFQIYD
jgi:gephyrin